MIAHVFPPDKPLSGNIDPPSSKNYTTRYVLVSCLSEGKSIVHRPAVQDDAVSLVECCRAMGATIEAKTFEGETIEYRVENAARINRLEVHGFGRHPRLVAPAQPLNPGNAGAVFRMLLAVSALLPRVTWVTDHYDSLGKRPNIDLIDALKQLGVEVQYRGDDGLLPMTLIGGRERIKAHIAMKRMEQRLADDDPFTVVVSGNVSSQFTSALLFLAPLLDEELRIEVTGRLKSLPLIETTRFVLEAAGVTVESTPERDEHLVGRGQHFRAVEWRTNGDWPGSAAILGAVAAVPGSAVTVWRLYQDEQGEKECVPFYRRMGCTITELPGDSASGPALRIESPATLKGASVNGDLCTDAVLAMMGVAMAAEGESRFVQIRNLQFKECDRVREPIDELRKVRETILNSGEKSRATEAALYYEPFDDPDTIHVWGAPQGYHGAIDVDGRGDHRVIMLLSIVALRCQMGLRIHGAEHVSKSFPGWFNTLRQMGVKVEEQF
ncbi:3-phosphoshikimate 1-carboxyvinyltransferase [Candidatus Sumerlaeota bacterium]|nr:3-phosphoshikimate 1-carboxyvinyltransferase [Candidatus Sumerlaeota bacterium]